MSCSCYDRERIKRRIKRNQRRLDNLLEREEEMTTGVMSYTIDTRSVTRYQISLKELQDAIKALEDEIAEDERRLRGCPTRRALAGIPREW